MERFKISQTARVLGYMKSGAWVSSLTFCRFGRPILRATARMHELRKAGYNIEKRFNHKGYWEYRLAGKS